MKRNATFLLTAALLTAALLTGATAASAQITYHLGVRSGANRALTTVDPASNGGSSNLVVSADKSVTCAWQAGLVLEARRGNVALQPALLFSQKGEKFNTSSAFGDFGTTIERTSINRYNWLELPLNAVYTLHGDHGLQVFAGPYVALAVGGHQSGTVTTYQAYGVPQAAPRPVAFDNQTSYGPNTNNRRLDTGVNFGIGYRQGPVQVQLGYGLGLRNLHQSSASTDIDPGFSLYHPRDFNADAAYNRVAQLTGTYFFAL